LLLLFYLNSFFVSFEDGIARQANADNV